MKGILSASLALALLLLLGGCEKTDLGTATGVGTGAGSGMGTFVVRLMDAPGGYDAVNIAVDSITVHIESGDTLSGWHTISRMPAVYNLLALANGRDTIVAGGLVPPGYYSQMRLYIGSGSEVVVNGVASPLMIPSGSQSGLKLNIQANVVAGVAYEVVLDFNAGQSIHQTGNGRYMLRPVIRVITSALSTGSLTGIVRPDTADAAVWAIAGTDTSMTFADTTGYFRFRYLNAGVYLVKVVPADTAYLEKDFPNVAVVVGQTTDLGTITLQKK